MGSIDKGINYARYLLANNQFSRESNIGAAFTILYFIFQLDFTMFREIELSQKA